MPDFLTRRNGVWHFVRRVPAEFATLDPPWHRPAFHESLGRHRSHWEKGRPRSRAAQ
jgi:hypothetical protein